ncbi:hypothetical protein CY34DRAFT_19582 [Suillus luteus UH-Slu-Lm8-n1]|uniref:Uncharacterized protein n=1 Tax=Suillus luteus UH-Slu-Lm8-n1 TaxID=930992 RepID=A0A0C9Z2U1_9AGAM|nr:hypothetical protein CY34DRAFT_19582 [Suillus luteus UH-Slu-Lm8-n1]
MVLSVIDGLIADGPAIPKPNSEGLVANGDGGGAGAEKVDPSAEADLDVLLGYGSGLRVSVPVAFSDDGALLMEGFEEGT